MNQNLDAGELRRRSEAAAAQRDADNAAYEAERREFKRGAAAIGAKMDAWKSEDRKWAVTREVNAAADAGQTSVTHEVADCYGTPAGEYIQRARKDAEEIAKGLPEGFKAEVRTVEEKRSGWDSVAGLGGPRHTPYRDRPVTAVKIDISWDDPDSK